MCKTHQKYRCASYTSNGVLAGTNVAHHIWCVGHTLFLQCASNVEKIAWETRFPQPYIIIVGSLAGDYSTAFLATDCKVLFEVEFDDIPIVLLAAFFCLQYLLPSRM